MTKRISTRCELERVIFFRHPHKALCSNDKVRAKSHSARPGRRLIPGRPDVSLALARSASRFRNVLEPGGRELATVSNRERRDRLRSGRNSSPSCSLPDGGATRLATDRCNSCFSYGCAKTFLGVNRREFLPRLSCDANRFRYVLFHEKCLLRMALPAEFAFLLRMSPPMPGTIIASLDDVA